MWFGLVSPKESESLKVLSSVANKQVVSDRQWALWRCGFVIRSFDNTFVYVFMYMNINKYKYRSCIILVLVRSLIDI